MTDIKLDKATREALTRHLVQHLDRELDVEIEPIDAMRLLDFLSETLGPFYYNQGLRDAQAIVRERSDTIIDALFDSEKPLPQLR